MNNKEKLIVQDCMQQLEKIDYNLLLSIIKPIIISYISVKATKSFIIHRENRIQNIKKICLPPELKLKCSDFDIKKIAAEEFKDILIHFTSKMKENFSQNNLINFYNNINSLEIEYSIFKFEKFIFHNNTAGIYDSKNNKIMIDENNISVTIYHELLHMASSVYKENISRSGFHQVSSKNMIPSLGTGLNEGYTELLNRRYFRCDESIAGSYHYEINIANKIEQIVGREKMENLYLNANLYGLVEELKKYSSDEEIMKFIRSTDFILFHFDNKNIKYFEKKMIIENLRYVNKFLISSYSKKLSEQYKNKMLNQEQLISELTAYASELFEAIKIKRKKYEILSADDVKESLSQIFKTTNPDLPLNKRSY